MLFPEDTNDPHSTDFVMAEKCPSVWILVGNISVHIIRTDEGVTVDLYAVDSEACDSLAATELTFDEAQEVLDEEKS